MDIPSNIFSGRELLPARVLGDSPERAVEGEIRLDIDDDSGLLKIETESGTGSMSLVEPLPGIMISFNDFHMERCVSGFSTSAEVLCIDWCEEGRLEQPMVSGSCAYVAAGDIKVDDRSNHSGELLLPTGRYRGVTVIYEVERAQKSILQAFEKGFPSIFAAFVADTALAEPPSCFTAAKAPPIYSRSSAGLRKGFGKVTARLRRSSSCCSSTRSNRSRQTTWRISRNRRSTGSRKRGILSLAISPQR